MRRSAQSALRCSSTWANCLPEFRVIRHNVESTHRCHKTACTTPRSVAHFWPTVHFDLNEDRFCRNLRSSRRGAAVGPSRMTSEHLRPLLEDVRGMKLFSGSSHFGSSSCSNVTLLARVTRFSFVCVFFCVLVSRATMVRRGMEPVGSSKWVNPTHSQSPPKVCPVASCFADFTSTSGGEGSSPTEAECTHCEDVRHAPVRRPSWSLLWQHSKVWRGRKSAVFEPR